MERVLDAASEGRRPRAGTRMTILWLGLALAAGAILAPGCAPRTLHAAIAAGNEKRAVQLAEKGKGIEERNSGGATPLHEAVVRNQKQVVASLIAAGADVNARMPQGHPPLYFVGRHGDLEMLAMLVEAGADVNASLHNGLTVLCCMFQNVNSEEDYERSARAAEALIAAGAAPDVGTHSFDLPPALYAWGVYFLAERAPAPAAATSTEQFATAADLFERLAEQQRTRHSELSERAKGVTGRNIGRGFGSFLVGVATGVATLGLVSYIPDPGYESKKSIKAQAEQAERLGELYDQTCRKCRQRIDPASSPADAARPDASLPDRPLPADRICRITRLALRAA